MPRFSLQAKKIFDLIWYKMDIDQSKIIFKELINPLDQAFVKVWFAFYYFRLYKPDLGLTELRESDEINKSNPDQLNSFFVYWLFFDYYLGSAFYSPMVSQDLTKQYFSKFESIYNQIEYVDEWEKHFCEGFYFFNKGFYYHRIETNLEYEIELCKKSNEYFLMMPEDGEFFSRCIGNIHLGYFHRLAGHFNESEKYFQIAINEAKKFNPFWQGNSLMNLCFLNMQKGEYEKAMEFNEKFCILSKELNIIPGIYFSLGVGGDLFYLEGKYEKALELYQESLQYRKKQNVPLEIVKGYIDIFFLYYQNFKLNKEKDSFTKAKEIFLELTKFHGQYPDDKSIQNYSNNVEARLLKYGNFTKRAKSVILFENLIKNLPYDFDIVKEYLELLFDDFLMAEDQETLEKIDLLMKKVYDLPMKFTSINSYLSQQIMLARYQFFINDNIKSAFDILNKAKEKISPFKIDRFNLQLDQEFLNFKNERTKWEKADFSIKERIEKSEFIKYIQEALNTKLV